jgi:hypothetical protein
MTRKLDAALGDATTLADELFNIEQRPRLPYIHHQVLRRAARRRIIKSIGFPALAIVAAIALSAVSISLPWRDAPTSAQNTASGAPAGGAEGLGFWPFVTEEASSEICPEGTDGHTSMRDAEATSAEFVGAYLGWTNASVSVERHATEITADVGNLPSTYIGGTNPETPHIELELSRIGDDRCWWVTGVSDPDDDAKFSVVVEDETLNANWDMPPGSQRADLIIVHGEPGTREFVAGDDGASSASFDGFEGPGFAIVVWKGSDGTVFSASGVTLPQGDSSASST